MHQHLHNRGPRRRRVPEENRASLVVQMVKNWFPSNTGDLGSIPGLGRSPGRGHGNPLQYSCLENPQGQRSLVGTVHTVAKSWTGLKRLSLSIFSRPGIWNHTCDHQFPLPSMPCCPDFLRCICDTSLLAGKYNFLGGNIIYLV